MELSNFKSEKIGYTISGSTSTYSPIHVFFDKKPKEEEIVIIEEKNRLLLGVLRKLQSIEPSLRQYSVTHFIWKPELIEEGKDVLNSYVFGLVYIIGELNNNYELIENKLPPEPGSLVYSLKSPELLNKIVRVNNPIYVGIHKYTKWQFPLNSNYLQYHIGIFGSTGSGKSRLAALLVKEIVEKTNYSIIVFDHSGVDYVKILPKYYNNTSIINSNEIYIPPNIVASVLVKLSNLNWQYYGDYFELASLIYDGILNREEKNNILFKIIELFRKLQSMGRKVYLPQILSELIGKKDKKYITLEKEKSIIEFIREKGWNKDLFIEVLSDLSLGIGIKSPTVIKIASYISWFLPQNFFEKLNYRTLKASDIIEIAKKNKLVVIDMSGDVEIEVKQSIIKSILEEVWRRVLETGEPQNIIFLIDEAQNYASSEWTICKDLIEKTAREGRKWKIGLILISQRFSSDISPSIRANLNTIFFSKITSQADILELNKFLELSGLDSSSIARLRSREFYVTGLMNPFPIPMQLFINEIS